MNDKKYFDIDEMMVDYAEMTSFNFNSPSYLACSQEKMPEEYAHQPYTFKFGQFDVLDMLQSFFSEPKAERV